MNKHTLIRWQPLLGHGVFPSEDPADWIFDDKDTADEQCTAMNDLNELLSSSDHTLKYQVKPLTHAPTSPGTRSAMCEANDGHAVETDPNLATCPHCIKEMHETITFVL